MEHESVFPAEMNPPRSPLSPAIKAKGLVYCSGQLAVSSDTGEVVPGDIGKQTEQVLLNLGRVLQAAGTDFDRVLKATVYMTDLSGFNAMNEVYRRFFPGSLPARTTIGVASLSRPGCLVEIDLIALA